MKIYTKKGDSGQTSLFGGKRLSKSELRIESYGTVDELNAHLGLVRDLFGDAESGDRIKRIQDELFSLGSELATENPDKQLQIARVCDDNISRLEGEIDEMEAALEPLTSFILPGGHPVVSNIHIARCVCRRAERRVVKLSESNEVNPPILQYLNRLSDYLFVLGRYAAVKLGAAEVHWNP